MTRPDDFTVRVDGSVCIGSGLCEMRAPATFKIDDDGAAIVRLPVGDDLETVRDAASQCPSGAISMIEGPGSTEE